MPIYAYRCGACGHAKDVLQKLSDPALTTCPACGEERFAKQLTAAGFQLKGTGWYATDFKGGGAKPADGAAKSDSPSDGKSDTKPDTQTGTKSAGTADTKPSTSSASSGDGSPKASAGGGGRFVGH